MSKHAGYSKVFVKQLSDGCPLYRDDDGFRYWVVDSTGRPTIVYDGQSWEAIDAARADFHFRAPEVSGVVFTKSGPTWPDANRADPVRVPTKFAIGNEIVVHTGEHMGRMGTIEEHFGVVLLPGFYSVVFDDEGVDDPVHILAGASMHDLTCSASGCVTPNHFGSPEIKKPNIGDRVYVFAGAYAGKEGIIERWTYGREYASIDFGSPTGFGTVHASHLRVVK